jgi:hypothetical protein
VCRGWGQPSDDSATDDEEGSDIGHGDQAVDNGGKETRKKRKTGPKTVAVALFSFGDSFGHLCLAFAL